MSQLVREGGSNLRCQHRERTGVKDRQWCSLQTAALTMRSGIFYGTRGDARTQLVEGDCINQAFNTLKRVLCQVLANMHNLSEATQHPCKISMTIPFYRWGHWGMEEQRHFSKVKLGYRSGAVQFQSPCSTCHNCGPQFS